MFFSHANRIWSAYAAILVLVALVLVWVSRFTLELDQRAELNRCDVLLAEQEAAQQERISRALWRMDWALSPLVAQEAARTYWMYQSFLPEPNDVPGVNSKVSKAAQKPEAHQPSPLLIRPSPWVKLHFQLAEDNKISSPQAPDGKLWQVAVSCGVAESELSGNCDRLNQIAGKLEFQNLWDSCSNTMLNQSEANLSWAMTPNDIAANQRANAQPQSLSDLAQSGLAQSGRAPDFVDNSENIQKQQATRVPSARGGRMQSNDYEQRGQAPNTMAVSQWQFNRFASAFAPPNEKSVVEGSLRPVWVDDRLLLIRRVESPRGKQVQGCWLDWTAIRASLLSEIEDIVPDADLVPHPEDKELSGPALATLPVDLIAPMISPIQEASSSSLSRMLPLLSLAWGGYLIAAFSIGWLIWGVTKLSERRATFASAVTHELRTPLTTFRLYSEMLASDMITDPAQRTAYASGLVKESDRLCRLVENVLQFARLERKQSSLNLQPVTTEQLLSKIVERCRIRADAAEMQFEFNCNQSDQLVKVQTCSDLVEQILFNLVDNSCKYAALADQKRIELSVSTESKWLVVAVRDYGPGIDTKMVRRLFRPFSRSSDETAGTAAGVGLGLSLSKQLAKRLGGQLTYVVGQPGCIFQLRLPL
ncbi:MAG: HAMP domain-containing sensor histidine kinase [Pirellulales bacterium]